MILDTMADWCGKEISLELLIYPSMDIGLGYPGFRGFQEPIFLSRDSTQDGKNRFQDMNTLSEMLKKEAQTVD